MFCRPLAAVDSGSIESVPADDARARLVDAFSFAAIADFAPGGRSAIDFGCGDGKGTYVLGNHYASVVGVDMSSEFIASAQRDSDGEISCCRFLEVSEPPLPFADRSFDLVYSALTLQHIPSTLCLFYVRELFRVSSRDGCIIFDMPSHELSTQAVRSAGALSRLHYSTVLATGDEVGCELVALRRYPRSAFQHYQYVFRRTS